MLFHKFFIGVLEIGVLLLLSVLGVPEVSPSTSGTQDANVCRRPVSCTVESIRGSLEDDGTPMCCGYSKDGTRIVIHDHGFLR